ncbi:hypothetical protein ES703_11953 [subsurface metagenome]
MCWEYLPLSLRTYSFINVQSILVEMKIGRYQKSNGLLVLFGITFHGDDAGFSVANTGRS